nr:hypothetical protein GCM10020093_052680 [Planobispora longispora]
METTHWWTARETSPQAGHPVAAPAVTARADEGDIVTLLHVPGTSSAPERGGDRTEDVVMRFGPGVPTETPAERIWRTGREQQPTLLPGEQARVARPSAVRRRRTVLSSVILALMVALGVIVWLLRGAATPLAVSEVEVVTPKKTQGCDTTVKIRGVLTTNGEAGEIHYQWRRSDKKAPIEQTDTVAAGETSHEVSLDWTVKGEGSFKGTATLRLLSPVPEGTKLEDKASFTYRCS